MFKFVVLAALACVAAAKPGIYGEHLAAPLAHEIQVPAAVSTSFRRDVIHKPVVTSYTVPEVVGHKQIVEKTLVPVVHKTIVQPAPIVQRTVVAPVAHHVAPVAHHVAPVVRHVAPVAPLTYAAPLAPLSYAAPVSHHVAPLSYAAPLAHAAPLPYGAAW